MSRRGAAREVELHYSGGMGHKEIAVGLAVHESTVARELRLVEAWLHRYSKGGA
ncbi:MAG: ECF-type sigma factor [Byssovorax sp.]